MASRVEEKKAVREERLRREAEVRDAERARTLRKRILFAVGAAVVVLAGLFAVNSAGGGDDAGGGATAGSGKFPYVVGDPGVGEPAPPVRLPATSGGRFDLAAMRGKTVLLYFQEGLMCQPCWDQIKDLERQAPKVKALGIDATVSITTDELGQLRQKVSDEGLRTPVLSDGDLAVSETYAANQYGMMGDSMNGHSFVVVGPDGSIKWRADYGGPPKYTMYVPMDNLLADMRKGLAGGA